MLRGKRVHLRLMEERDIPLKVKWFSDPDVLRTLNVDFPISEVGTRHWLHNVSRDETRRDFVICLNESERPIGYAGLVNIDLRHGKAETYLGIGEKEYWGQGLGTEAKELQLEYAFEHLRLNRVYSLTWTENQAMIAINKKFGYKIEGVLRQDSYAQGMFRDKVIMGLLRDEYYLYRRQRSANATTDKN